MTTYYSAGYIAEGLGLRNNVIYNWRRRYGDTPSPNAWLNTGHGTPQPMWDAVGVEAWHRWAERHYARRLHRGSERSA